MKLLALRLDAAGDVLMCTPALHALASDGHRVSLMTSTAGAPAAEYIDAITVIHCEDERDGHSGRSDHHPHQAERWEHGPAHQRHPTRDVLRFDAPWMKASAPCAPDVVSIAAARLRARQFDAAVIFTSHTQSPLPAAVLCQMAGIPLRLAHCRENPYQLLTHWVRDTEPERFRHEVQRQLDLVATLGCVSNDRRLRIRLSADDDAAAILLLQSVGIADGQPFVLLHPGASAPSRRYPARHWHSLMRLLATTLTLPIVIAGGAHEQSLATRLAAVTTNSHSLAGLTNFGTLAALIARASVLVACNSAPAHLAAAMQTPVVDLYALTNLQHTPWQVACRVLSHPVPCAGCLQSVCPYIHHACLEQVTPQRVLAAVQELLAER